MSEKRIKRLFQQTGDTIQAILEYFRMQDKVLWTGSLTVGGKLPKTLSSKLNKYRSVGCVINVADGYLKTVICHKESDGFYGGTVLANWSNGAHLTAHVSLVKSSDGTYAMSTRDGYLGHSASSPHGKYFPWESSGYHVVKIIGIDPAIPDALFQIMGGVLQNKAFRRCMA